jgi:putative transport protein
MLFDLFVEYPLVLLFTVISVGYLLGNFTIKGNSLGVATVLFVGLFFGALDSRFDIPDIIFQLGLSIFVYSVGLSSGPAFFKAYKRNGIRDFTFASLMLAFSGLLAAGLWFIFDFSAAMITGAYSGSTTNTPALAGVLEYISKSNTGTEAELISQDAVLGYTFSYPMGVLGGIIAIVFMEKWLKIDYKKEQHELRKDYPISEKLTSCTIKITAAEFAGREIRDLYTERDWNVNFGRLFKENDHSLTKWSTKFEVGDMVVAVGSKLELEKVIGDLGEKVKTQLTSDRSQYDSRRIFVSNPKMTGQTIASLNLDKDFNAVITRLRRGDVDMIVRSDTILELGDRIRFIARRKDLNKLSKLFGDSYSAVSKVNLFSFGLGIGLGLLIGTIEIPMPGFSLKLGYAGGPLLAGLLLGAIRRSGNIVWTMPYSANVTLQQIGLILLLSAIGIGSGSAFSDGLDLSSLKIFIASAAIALFTAFATLFVGYKIVKMPFSILLGMVSNNPAILDFAINRSGNRLPMFGFSQIFPIALIFKIVIAQLLYLFLS